MTSDHIAELRRQMEAARLDWLAHIKGHSGPFAETMVCTRLSGVCHGDGEGILARYDQQSTAYNQALTQQERDRHAESI